MVGSANSAVSRGLADTGRSSTARNSFPCRVVECGPSSVGEHVAGMSKRCGDDEVRQIGTFGLGRLPDQRVLLGGEPQCDASETLGRDGHASQQV